MLLAKILRLIAMCALALVVLGADARLTENTPLEKNAQLHITCAPARTAQTVDAPEEIANDYDQCVSEFVQYLFNFLLHQRTVYVNDREFGGVTREDQYSLDLDDNGAAAASRLRVRIPGVKGWMYRLIDAIDPGQGSDMLGKHPTLSSADLLGKDQKDLVGAVARVDRGISEVAKSLSIDLSKMSRDQAVYLFNNIDAKVPEFRELYKTRADRLIEKLPGQP